MAKDMKNDITAASVTPAGKKESNKEKKTKSGHRWSVADTAISLLVLLAIAGMVYRLVFWNGDGKASSETGNNIYAIKYTVGEMYEAAVDELEAFDKISLYDTGDYIGYIAPYDDYTPVIKKTYIRDSVEAVTLADGASGGSYRKVSLEGIIFCNACVLRDGSLFIVESDRYISAGSELTVATDTVSMNIKVIEIYQVQ